MIRPAFWTDSLWRALWLVVAAWTLLPIDLAAEETGAPELLVELETDTRSPYVQAQVLVTLRLLRGVEMYNAALSTPTLTNPETDRDVIMLPLDSSDRRYRTERNDRLYVVNERRYALFAETSGTLQLGPSVFQGQVIKDRRRISFERGQSNIIMLEVKPIPDAFTGDVWIPAKSVELYQEYQPKRGEIDLGEPLARNVFLAATGLSGGQLPDFNIEAADGSRVYPQPPQREEQEHPGGLTAVLQQEIDFVPTRAGTIRIPAMEIPWWNTETDRQEVVRFPGRTITGVAAAPQTVDSDKTRATEPTELTMGWMEYRRPSVSIWILIVSLAAVGFALLFFGWRLMSKRQRAIGNPSGRRSLLRRALAACADNEPAAAARAVMDLARTVAPSLDSRSLGRLAPDLPVPLRDELVVLNQILYARHENTWQGAGLTRALQQWQKQHYALGGQQQRQDLPVLFPLTTRAYIQ